MSHTWLTFLFIITIYQSTYQTHLLNTGKYITHSDGQKDIYPIITQVLQNADFPEV